MGYPNQGPPLNGPQLIFQQLCFLLAELIEVVVQLQQAQANAPILQRVLIVGPQLAWGYERLG